MAGGKITRITSGLNSLECDSWTVYTDEFNVSAGGKSTFTADKGTNYGIPKEPENKAGYFVKGWWTNHKNEPIKRAIYGQNLKFHIQMNRQNVSIGDIVYFSLYDSDMRSFGNDIVKADDPIRLVHIKSKKPYTYEKVNTDYKVIIEFRTDYDSLANASIKDRDGIYELYFRCSYVNKGKKTQHIELPLSFSDYLNMGSIVIDRYKMPGLNPEGTGIAEDMAYGKGNPYKGKLLYNKAYVEQYIKEYTETGFDINKHRDFANIKDETNVVQAITSDERNKQTSVQHQDAEKNYRNKVPTDNLRVEKRHLPVENIIKNQEEVRKNNEKAIYSKEEIESLGKLTKLATQVKDEKFLWADFRILKSVLTWGDLSPVLDAMISKFKDNKGGIFVDNRLNENIKDADSTKRYCKHIEDFIAEKLKNSFNKLEEVEDKQIDWGIENKKNLLERKNKNKITGQKNKKGEDQVFTTPLFPYNRYSENNLLEGRTLALNDIWATEVILKEIKFIDKENYTARYEVTLWDHFGLDKPDLEKFYSYGAGFRAWFVLQHLWGYKPFLTKITFEKEFFGNLQKGIKEREQQRELEKQQSIDKWVEEERQKMWLQPKY